MSQLNDETKEFIRNEISLALKDLIRSGEAFEPLKLMVEQNVLEQIPDQVEAAMRMHAIEQFKEEEAGEVAETRRAIISHNRLVAQGDSLKKVPFAKTEDAPPIYRLPPLTTKDSVYDLTEDEVLAYCQGYGISPSGDLDMDRLAINDEIGAVPAKTLESTVNSAAASAAASPAVSSPGTPLRRSSPKLSSPRVAVPVAQSSA